jgi:alpha-N-arabinofuranosidase
MAEYFNAFIRHADVVKMANYTMMTSLLSRDRQGDLYKSPSFYTFKMFSNNCRGIALEPLVRCDTFSTSSYYRDIPYLDVTSVYDKTKRYVVINVVNRHEKKAVNAQIVSDSGPFSGEATVTVVAGGDLKTPYSYANRKAYVPVAEQIKTSGERFTYSFPAHSFTQIMVKIR